MIFVDTWGWVILRDRRDPLHDEVSRLVEEAFKGRAILTTDYVVAETITLAYARFGSHSGECLLDALLAMLDQTETRLERIDTPRFEEAIELRRRYRDKSKISFTDLTSMVVMRELGITEIVTADRHFEQVNLGFRIVPGR
jgi:predicted nucleic acid-binding protein